MDLFVKYRIAGLPAGLERSTTILAAPNMTSLETAIETELDQDASRVN